jgi:hypothetical protein
MGVIEYPEDPAVTAIREALGAVAVGEPATYWLYADAAGDWCVRREGSSQPQRFETREQALAFARLAVVRCASYCLHLQGTDGPEVLARKFGQSLCGEHVEAGVPNAYALLTFPLGKPIEF